MPTGDLDLPADWGFVLLDAVARRGSGHTPDKKRPTYWAGYINWVSLRDSDRLDDRFINDTAATVTAAGLANSAAVLHPAGTVVMTRDAGVGRSAILGKPMAVSQHFIAWTCGPRLDNRFLYYWLQSKKPEFERVAAGNTIKTIGVPYFKNLRVPLPPLAEQVAIADALEDADRLLVALDRLIDKKTNVKRGTTNDLVHGRRRLAGFEAGWTRKTLSSCGRFRKGRDIRRSDISEEGLSAIRYGEIYTRYDNYVERAASCIRPEVAAKAMPIRRGEILMAGSGETATEIGKAVAYLGSEEAYAGGDIIVYARHGQDPIFLAHLLNAHDCVSQKSRLAQGDAVVHISARNLGQISVALPPLDEQAAISDVLLQMDREVEALCSRRTKLQLIKQGMMQSLLSGDIRLQDLSA